MNAPIWSAGEVSPVLMFVVSISRNSSSAQQPNFCFDKNVKWNFLIFFSVSIEPAQTKATAKKVKVPGQLPPLHERIGLEDPRVRPPVLPDIREILGPAPKFPDLEVKNRN